jgi:hypothetical protein
MRLMVNPLVPLTAFAKIDSFAAPTTPLGTPDVADIPVIIGTTALIELAVVTVASVSPLVAGTLVTVAPANCNLGARMP